MRVGTQADHSVGPSCMSPTVIFISRTHTYVGVWRLADPGVSISEPESRATVVLSAR